MITTLNKIRAHSPCTGGWIKLLKNLGKTCADDEPLKITTILDSNGLEDALWCLRAVDGYQSEMRLYAVDCARSVQHLMSDPRSIAAVDVAERHANGLATDSELDAARAAMGAARTAARDARAAAWGAERAAMGAARTAAGNAEDAAAWGAAWAAAWTAAWDAGDSMDAARSVQADLLRIVCSEIEQRGEA
jgi:hypothetical protein